MKKILSIVILFISCSFSSNNSIPLTQGLVAQWLFKEGGGNILINSAPNNSGTNGINNNGATWDVSPFGKCLKFVRTSSQFVSCALPPCSIQGLAGTPVTMSAWINCTSASLMTIMADWNINVAPGWEFTISEFNAGKIDIIFVDAGGLNYFGRRGSTNVNDGTWKHVVMTYDGSGANTGINLYVNGVLETMTNISAGSFAATLINGNFRIGCRMLTGANNQFFDGKMSMPMVWKRALTPTEVWQLYANSNQMFIND